MKRGSQGGVSFQRQRSRAGCPLGSLTRPQGESGAEQSAVQYRPMRAGSRFSRFSLSPAGTLAALDCGGWQPPHSLTAPVSSPELPTGMGTLLSCQGTGLPASPPNKPCCCQAAGAKTNNNSSVTQVLCRKGEGCRGGGVASVQAVG